LYVVQPRRSSKNKQKVPRGGGLFWHLFVWPKYTTKRHASASVLLKILISSLKRSRNRYVGFL
jgi:hypothetical protein